MMTPVMLWFWASRYVTPCAEVAAEGVKACFEGVGSPGSAVEIAESNHQPVRSGLLGSVFGTVEATGQCVCFSSWFRKNTTLPTFTLAGFGLNFAVGDPA